MGKPKAEWFLILAGASLIVWMQQRLPAPRLRDSITLDYNEAVAAYPTDFLRLSSFGYGHGMSALLWLRFLQQTPVDRVEAGRLSWIYYDLNSVTELDPDFFPAYEHGGIFLSVVTEDKLGAERILLKGTQRFPDRWRLHAYLAYHYQWELDQPDKAARQYLAAAALPDAPPILKVLAGSAMARLQGNEAALGLLKGFLRTTSDPAARLRIQQKIEKLRKGGA